MDTGKGLRRTAEGRPLSKSGGRKVSKDAAGFSGDTADFCNSGKETIGRHWFGTCQVGRL